MNASLNHLLCILSLRTLVNRITSHLRNILLLLIPGVEPCALVGSQRQFVLFLNVVIDSLVLETISLELLETCVFFRVVGLRVELLLHALQGLQELLERDLAVVVQVELFHEQIDFFFQRGEAIRFKKEFFDFVGGDEATAVPVYLLESCFEFFWRENVDAEGVN